MAFLIKSELKTVGQISLIDKIVNEDNTIVDDIINESIALMSSHLSRHYDIVNIFNKTGANRHKQVVKYLKDIVIYEIYDRRSLDQSAGMIRKYQEAMNWLEKLNTGEFGDKTLPVVESTLNDSGVLSEGNTRFGGNKKYANGY